MSTLPRARLCCGWGGQKSVDLHTNGRAVPGVCADRDRGIRRWGSRTDEKSKASIANGPLSDPLATRNQSLDLSNLGSYAMRSLARFTALGVVVLFTAPPLLSAEPAATPPEDRQALLENLEETVRTINNQDSSGNSAVFTEDGDHITPFGVASKGPKEIGAMMEQAFRDFPRWRARCQDLETRLLTPTVALQFRQWSEVDPPSDSKFPEKSPEFVVLIKR